MPAMSGSSSKVTITSLPDGPLQVDGEVEILASDGTVVKETTKSFLCRCGHSSNKPFCDGAHKREGFTSS
jgi:CDGSH-type Zn-finger protein